MTVIRENILANTQVKDKYLEGVRLLDEERQGITAQDLFDFIQRNNLNMSLSGIQQELSTYDLFVFWHVTAMQISLPVGNAAHNGPIFLPWHRMYLRRFEENLQRVLQDDEFALPYWDWAADGELDVNDQWRTQLWSEDYLGEARGTVRSGVLSNIQVRLAQDPLGNGIVSIDPRPVERAAGMSAGVPDLPSQAQLQVALDEPDYDREPWSNSVRSHRNILEGWFNGPSLHNRVHVWIGRDMSLGTSPNDPAFFLNHCFVDRVWEIWMAEHGRNYAPQSGEGPEGHRIDSQMVALLGESLTPQDVLEADDWYVYDNA